MAAWLSKDYGLLVECQPVAHVHSSWSGIVHYIHPQAKDRICHGRITMPFTVRFVSLMGWSHPCHRFIRP